MNKKYIDGLSDETLAEMIDRTLLYKKTAKTRNMKANLFKIIPAIAAVALVIGVVNIIGAINTGDLFSVKNPGAATIKEDIVSNGVLTDIPIIIEKSVFENLIDSILKDDSSERAVKRLKAYYMPKDFGTGLFYVFDANANEREIIEILGYWNDYIGWDDADYHEMLLEYQMLAIESELRFDSELRREEKVRNEVNGGIDWFGVWSGVIASYEYDYYENPEEYWNKYAWILSNENGMYVFTLKNGTKIETTGKINGFAFLRYSDDTQPHGSIETAEDVMITLANGIIITVPENTVIKAMPVKDADHTLEIIIGNGNAAVTQPDGTSTEYSSGTILDGEANVIN
ncbi:MAG: hypothetical protein FWF15_12160 [Oscillospiraceae bacterium]|nr:hypothetical protein [Oscillospiraceae bacterium]